tara:strand:- start:1398 stop:3149 length:1752 start_codon:yes stop_codon:yes gene_type:complete
MSSYWKVDDTMRIGQKYISIPSENGLEYSPEQKIQIFVDPSTKFMSGQDSYLDFNFQIKLPSGSPVPTRLALDQMGGSALIKNIRIYDGSRGTILEELDSYSSLCSVRYDYDTDDSTRNFRALREGSGVHNHANRGTMGSSYSVMANTLTNPYFKKVEGNQNASNTWTNDAFLKAKLCIPLHTGIFAQNNHIFPVMMTNGLYIEIDTPPAGEVIKQLDSVLKNRRTKLNPFFHSLNGSLTGPDNWPANASTFDTFYVSKKNNLSGNDAVSKFPFVIGETFKFCNFDDITETSKLGGTATISEINLSSNGLIEVKLSTAIANNGAGASAITSEVDVMFSTAVEDATSYEPSYTISNVNLIISEIMLDPNYERGMIQKVREGKNIEIDIMTATNYKHSILASDRQTTFQIYAQNSRAKSLLVVPQDSSVYSAKDQICASGTYEILKNEDSDDTALFSNRSGYTGACDELKDIQYQLQGRLVPSRPIDVSKIASRQSIDAFHLYELEKCLDNAGIVPRSFRAFKDNFVFGRGFGVNQGALDLRGKDLAVILKYTNSDAPSKGKLFNSFVVHVRRLLIGTGSVQVVL